MKSGKLSKTAAEKKLVEARTKMFRNGGNKSAAKVDRRGKGVKGVEPRFISEEEYNRVSAELRKQASEGRISREEATQKIVEMQQANTMAHIEKSVKEGKTTRAEADALLKKLGYK